MLKINEFKIEVEKIINELGIDSYFNIDDFILAEYLVNQLEVLDTMEQQKYNNYIENFESKGE